MTEIARADVRRAFSRAAPRYDAVADYQREVGKRLLAGLPWPDLSGRVLDLGCGTGHGSALLSHAFAGLEVTALDFALPMVQRLFSAPPVLPFKVCADAQQLPLRDGCFDFCWSSLALQWCDPAQVFGEIARVLKPGGRLALTTLGPATFAELRQAFAAVDNYRHTIDFCDEGPLREALLQAGMKTMRWERRSIALYRPDVRSLLAGVRELGANRIANVQPDQRRNGLMGKAAWQRLQQAFETLRTPRGLPLTYDTFFIYAEK